MRIRRNFKMAAISIVLLITGGILIVCGKEKTREEKIDELISELQEQGSTEDPKQVVQDAYDKTFLKTNKNGWNESTNKVYSFSRYTIILPDYFLPKTDKPISKDDGVSWRFKSDDNTYLTLASISYTKTEITSDVLNSIYEDQKKSYKEFDGVDPIYSTYNKLEKTDLIYYTASVKFDNDIKARNNTAIYVSNDRTLIITIISKDDSKYDYSDDFINIMLNVK